MQYCNIFTWGDHRCGGTLLHSNEYVFNPRRHSDPCASSSACIAWSHSSGMKISRFVRIISYVSMMIIVRLSFARMYVTRHADRVLPWTQWKYNFSPRSSRHSQNFQTSSNNPRILEMSQECSASTWWCSLGLSSSSAERSLPIVHVVGGKPPSLRSCTYDGRNFQFFSARSSHVPLIVAQGKSVGWFGLPFPSIRTLFSAPQQSLCQVRFRPWRNTNTCTVLSWTSTPQILIQYLEKYIRATDGQAANSDPKWT